MRRKEVSNGIETVRVTSKLRLAEKTSSKVVVESQVSVERPGQPLVENPPSPVEYPATFPLPANMRQEQFTLPSLKARLVGDDLRCAGDTEFKAQLFTWQEVNETGPMAIKLWRSNEIPGRFLRQEVKGHNHDSIEEVVEILPPPHFGIPSAP